MNDQAAFRNDANENLPTFAIAAAPGASLVQVRWRDGSPGPTIVFEHESEARIWIARDSAAWARRFFSSEVENVA